MKWNLFFHQAHDTDAGQYRLPAQTFPWHAISKCLWTISYRLTQVPHEERNICPAESEKKRAEGRGHRNKQSYFCMIYSSSHLTVFSFSLCNLSVHQCFLLELLFAFATQVSYQPLAGESILRRHSPSHHCIQESFPLTSVKAQYLLHSQNYFWWGVFLFITQTKWKLT